MSGQKWTHVCADAPDERWECRDEPVPGRLGVVSATVSRVNHRNKVHVEVGGPWRSFHVFIPRDILEAALKPLDEERS